jgi:hypothetical protein
MSIFDQPVTSDMGCSLIDICSISVLFLPNCIVKPFISFTTCVSGTTLSVPSVYFISICIYFINVPHGIFCHVMLALYVSNVSYFLGVNVAIVPQWQHQKNVFVVLKCPQFTPRCYQRTCSVLQRVTFLFPTALTDMFFTSACMSSWKMLVHLTTTSQ